MRGAFAGLFSLIGLVIILVAAPAPTRASTPSALPYSMSAPYHGTSASSGHRAVDFCAWANERPRPAFDFTSGRGTLNASTGYIACSYFPGWADANASLVVKIPLATIGGVSTVTVNLTYGLIANTVESLYCGPYISYPYTPANSTCSAFAGVNLTLSGTIVDRSTSTDLAYAQYSTGWIGVMSQYTCINGTCGWANTSMHGGSQGRTVASSSVSLAESLSSAMLAGEHYALVLRIGLEAASGDGPYWYNSYGSAYFHASGNMEKPGRGVTLTSIVES